MAKVIRYVPVAKSLIKDPERFQLGTRSYSEEECFILPTAPQCLSTWVIMYKTTASLHDDGPQTSSRLASLVLNNFLSLPRPRPPTIQQWTPRTAPV